MAGSGPAMTLGRREREPPRPFLVEQERLRSYATSGSMRPS